MKALKELEPETIKHLETLEKDGHKMSDRNINEMNAIICAYKKSGSWDKLESFCYYGSCCEKHALINLVKILK